MMFNGYCDFGSWGSLGNFGVLGWIGLILNLIFWIGLIVGFAVLVVWAIRRAQVPAGTVAYGSGQPTTKAILQTRYARGEITRDQYQRMKQDIGKSKVSEIRKGESE
jgi:putative membrane protein